MGEAKEQNKKRPTGEGTGPTRSFDSPVVGPGGRIGPFRIERELGRGGAGVVYLAHDTKLDRSVAIKSVPAELADDPAAQSRFLREAKLLASLNHPNIAAIHEELEEAEGAVYLVLEYVPGQTLGERIAKGGLTLKETLSIACEIAEAISYAHDKGVIHRDLKPGNIKITPEGRIKVLDLGIAKMIGAPSPAAVTITEPGQVIGTPGYMSPEQARGNPADHRTDIWSFGCILYEMLTGICPFPGPTASEALASILKIDPDWQRLPAEVGADIRQIIHKCLQKDPAQRYQSANELCEDLRKSREVLTARPPKPVDLKALLKLLKRPKAEIVVALFLLVICLTAYGIIRHIKNHRWAIGSIPDIIKMIESDQYLAAFQLSKKVEKYIPGNEMLNKLWPEMSRELSIITTPPGADIFFKEYSDIDGQWLYLGQSPQESIKFPLGFYRCKFSKEGFEIRETFVSNRVPERMLEIELQETGSSPGMVLVRMTPSIGIQPGSEIDYLIDKYEVTNEQFQKFIDAGGYTKQEYWKHKFVKDGRELSMEQARETFKDTTGRPGPSTWAGGTYPSGQDDYPVGGISWYEATAYAEFIGKDLPPRDCWWYAAGDWQMFSGGESLTNFGDGPAPVGSYQGVGIHGLYDMAGNVREWCWNATDDSGNQRYIRGGSWEDPDYMFFMTDVRSPWDRDRGNGFRCVRYIRGKNSIPDSYFEPKEPRTIRDYTSITPLSEKKFEVFRELCRYDQTELDPNVEWFDDSHRHWSKEKITFNAAYGGERIIAYLFLPKGVKKPYQPIIAFPHIGSLGADFGDIHVHDFVIKSGRAVLYPIYKGTYERRFDEGGPWEEPIAYRDWHVQMVKDLSRSIDYLETKTEDIDIGKLTFYGQSWGAMEGPLMLAMEDRIKLGIFDDGGFPIGDIPKEGLDIARFAGHVDVPVLMINGKRDSIFPYETHQLPLYEVLKANNEKTIHRLYSGPHGIFGFFSTQITHDVSMWLDEHLGPVDFESQKP